ncbi:MAG: pectate lyase, partial [Chitinispirillia bacterium]
AAPATIPNADPPMLPQEGNPINTALDNYKEYLKGDAKLWGDIVASWQFDNGAFPKQGFKEEYQRIGLATEAQRKKQQAYRKSLGTFDNLSTTTELASLGHSYKHFNEAGHKAAAQKAMDFILKAQGNSGGWPQWYPSRGKGHYSAHATYNDDAMARVLICLQKAVRKKEPFDSDIFTEDQLKRCEAAIEKGVDYILKSQIKMGDKLTVWCAQHGMEDYKPKTARSYELPSKSGNESTLVVAFLMSCPQTPEIAEAVKGAIDWYNDPNVYVADTKYVRPKKKSDKSFADAPGKKMWYRFYELNTNKHFFCDRDGKPTTDINKLSEDRYTGYVWAGAWAEDLLEYAAKIGLIPSTGITAIKNGS